MNAVLADPDLLFRLTAGSALLVALGLLIHVRPQVGIALFVALVAVSTDLRTPVLELQISVAGVQIGLLDAVSGAMLVSALVRTATGNARGPLFLPIWILVGLFTLNVLRGVHQYGLQLAFNEARSWVYLLAALSFCAASPVRSARWWMGLGLAYCSWLVFRVAAGLAMSGVHPVTSYIEIGGKLTDPRPITAAAAAVLAQAMLFLAVGRSRRRDLVAVMLLGGLLVVIQHRTVWFAAAGGLAYLGLRALRHGGRGRLAAVLAAGGLALGGLLALLTGAAQRSAVAVSAENVTASNNTFAWRVSGWRELLQEQLTAMGSLFGSPFGAGFRRVVDGQVVAVSPHSHYVETVLRFGLIGLVASIVVVVAAWRAASSSGWPVAGSRSALIVLAIFAVTYRCDPVQGILVGTILGLSAGRPADVGAPARPQVPPSRSPAMAR